MPDYLAQIDRDSQANTFNNLQDSLKYKNLYLHYVSNMFGPINLPKNVSSSKSEFHFDVTTDKLWNDNRLNEENGSVGILLATKALIQLISTPFVKNLINSFGYRVPTVLGTFVLFLASSSK